MSLNRYLSFLIPQTLETRKSKINGQIKVVNFAGKPRIIVNKLIQSGGMVEQIWKKGLKSIQHPASSIQNVMILGLGGGSVAKLVNERFPKAKIVGVEIDLVMIRLGKKYFGLDEIKNLKVINSDALIAINNEQLAIKDFDLILVDVFQGSEVPRKLESSSFLKNLKKLVSNNGLIIFNRLFYGKHRKNTEEFIGKLEEVFKDIKLVRAWSNLLVFCKK